MESWLHALGDVFLLINILAVIFGTFFGLIMGALPGMSSTMAVAIAIPFTFAMEPTTGLILLAAIYCSSVYGGSIPAILLNTPGTPAGAATVMDGFELTKQGSSGKALGISVIASAAGGIISAIILSLAAPLLAEQALKFGPPEYFALAVFGLTIVSSLTGKNIFKGLMAAALGILIATVGLDPIEGTLRYTFGNDSLIEGFALVPVLIGLFSISQALMLVKEEDASFFDQSIMDVSSGVLPRLKEVLRVFPNILRSSLIGTGVGIIPGAGSDPAAFIAYNEAKRWSKHPDKFGTGVIDGVVAPESSNNAVTGGALIPLLTLGIPGNSVTAVFLGGIIIHGLAPGPKLFVDNAEIVYALFISLFLSNVAFLILGLFGTKYFTKILKIDEKVLGPIILVLSIVGSYAIHNSYPEIWVMLAFGIIGYLLRLLDVPLAPIILAIILGPLAENGFRQSMIIADGNLSVFMTRPISAIFLIIALITFITPFVQTFLKSKKES